SELITGNANECVPYKIDNTVLACVCNATYCDSTPPYDVTALENGYSYWYMTNKDGLRLKMSKTKFSPHSKCHSGEIVNVDHTKKYQTILGFGGAFADSVGINLKKLSPATQDQLIRTYFDQKSGSKYSISRIPIAGTDFSTRIYTYDDVVGDNTLDHFALAKEDYEYKIPYIKKALELNPDIKFYASSWSPPYWMKTNGERNGYGFLKDEYKQTYANYLIKFLDGYKAHGINMWALTTGNEPLNSFVPDFPLTTMAWTPDLMADWVANYMGPTLANSTHNNTIILALDDNRIVLPWFVNPIFTDEKSSKYTGGTAVHWYQDAKQPPEVLDWTHEQFPDKIILMSEAAEKPQAWGSPNILQMSWDHAESYILSIIEYMNHWAVGWVDWCLALDEDGGPTWLNNNLDSAVMVNPPTDEFYKLPMFYAIKHVSRFVDRGSVRISVTDTDTVKATAFLTPAKETVVILYNRDNSAKHITLKDSKKGYPLCLELSPKSINTIIYKH
ncbi:lysosomal acid glucosylceramidase-like, partial [Calliopsis andreniformis]|uniref:lysosomal acid glucosylceramidase-like n=1 Tax=Calliopsis andreniformis TaxID=337506 RepID=UPI003FCD3E0E